ncbi:MAG TPA: VanZ family protein [Thermoanaerobaculia bacterium]|nr:VanZ family protein [Thermoanaerobaculia bacterium]
MWPLGVVVVVTVAALALRRSRWAAASLRVSRWTYGLLMPLSLLYFPAKSGFRLTAPSCEWTFGLALAKHSLTNYPHIVLFAIFFLLTYAQLPHVPRAMLWSMAACLAMGLLVELAQAVSGYGHCRMRDLIPDSVGAVAGAALVTAASRAWPRNREEVKRLLVLALLASASFHCSKGTADRPMNFSAVDRAVYRGGRPSASQIAALRRDLHVRTIIRLNRGDATADRAAARLAGIRLIEIPIDPKKLGTSDVETRGAVERAFAALSEPRNRPVYIHCDHGRDRTGFLIALYRARRQGWSLDAISRELDRHGHGFLMRRYLPNITRQLAQEVAGRPDPASGG